MFEKRDVRSKSKKDDREGGALKIEERGKRWERAGTEKGGAM